MKKLITLLICFVSVILLLYLFGFHLHVIISNSMQPDIPVGSMIITKNTSFKEVKPRDVIVYKKTSEKYTVAHRIIEKHSNFLITKGDANNAADGKIPAADVKEKVLLHMPQLGYIVAYVISS